MSQRLRELEARVLRLQGENEALAERATDATLLGLVAEHLYLESEADGILRAGLEQVSILKEVPFCAVGELTADALLVRQAYHARSHERLDGRILRLPPRVCEQLLAGAVALDGPACAEAGLTAGTLSGLSPDGALLVPFSCRSLPRGAFLFAVGAPGARLLEATPVLLRVAEAVAIRLENVALLHELVAINGELDQRVADRTAALTAANRELEREVGERRRTEAALRASEAALRLTLAEAAMATFEWDPDTDRLRWSEEAAGLMGAAPATLQAWLALVHPEERATVAAALAAAPQGGQRSFIALRVGAPPGRWLELHAGASAGGEERIPRVAGVIYDVTERRRLEEELRQAQKLESIGRLAGGVAHDFNNLLTTILGVAEIAALEAPAGGSLAQDLGAILDAGRHAAALTRQLLAFSRNQRLEMRPLQLTEVCRTFSPMLARLIGEEIKVWLDLEADTPAVLGDGTQVEQVLMNLAINARDAMPRGGRLTIEVAKERIDRAAPGGPPAGPWVRLSVIDTGSGMTPEVAARAFEPFFTTKERGQGTGLGLATVYGVVRQHGGHARLKTTLGKGTRFDLYFPPAAPLAMGADFGTAARPAVGGGETVLVVDDEPSVRRVVRVLLERLGYQVLEAAGGEEALTALDMAGGRVDVLLSDVIMPGMRGPELARAFQKRCPGRPVVLMSGYTDGATEQGDGVASGFVSKPLTPESLARALRAALDAA